MAAMKSGRSSLSQPIDRFAKIIEQHDAYTEKYGADDTSSKLFLVRSLKLDSDNKRVICSLFKRDPETLRGQSWGTAVLSDLNRWLAVSKVTVEQIAPLAGGLIQVILSYSRVLGDTRSKPFPLLTMWGKS
jgi:hypothetical protein